MQKISEPLRLGFSAGRSPQMIVSSRPGAPRDDYTRDWLAGVDLARAWPDAETVEEALNQKDQSDA